MAKYLFSPEARRDLVEIGDYIAFHLQNRAAAQNLIKRIRKEILSLEEFPESGTPVCFPGPSFVYRYLICGNYMIFYHLAENIVQIDRILYGRQDYLSVLFGNECTDECQMELNQHS